MAEIPTIIRNCGALAADALTFGVMSRAAERERLVTNLRLTFPDDWELLLATMGRFELASADKISPLIKQMWARGVCTIEETMALHSLCPAAFRSAPIGKVVGRKANEVLPELAKALS